MIRQIQQKHEIIHSLELRIAKHKETMASGIFTTEKQKLEATSELVELNKKLEQANYELYNI